MKRIVILLTALSLIMSAFVFNASAASATIAFSSKAPKVGESVNITVTVSTTGTMYSTEFDVKYNEAVLKFESGDSANGGAGIVKVAGGVAGATRQSYTLKFTVIKAGSCTVSASGNAFLADTEESIAASAVLNASDVTKSDNANLKSLRVSAGTLSPKFSQSVTSYTVNVKNNVTECKVYVEPVEGDAAKVGIEGSSTLKVGQNVRVITVTAPSGAQKKYTVTIIRAEEGEELNESSEASSTQEEPSPLETVIDGVSYVVLSDISAVELPVGFNATKRLYNNEEISVASDEKGIFELFYLKAADSDTVVPYTYDDGNNLFKKVQIIAQGSNSYIVAEIPDDLEMPENFSEKTVKIGDLNINAFVSDENSLRDMYYIYCYFGGDYSMYRYDSLENVLQRCPDFEFEDVKNTDANTDGTSGNTFADRFGSLSSNAKTIVVCLIIALLGVIALIVLIIIKLVSRNKNEDFVLDEEEFESVKFDDDFEIISDEENE